MHRKGQNFRILFLVFVSLIFQTFLFSQVGINETNPKQALDVGGRIEVGDDKFANDTEGSIKYNPDDRDLEGYTAEGWKSLTRSGGIPTNAVFVTGRVSVVDNNGIPVALAFRNTFGNLLINNTVPSGKYLLITSITVAPVSLNDFNTEEPFYNINFEFSGNSAIEIAGKYVGGVLYESHAGYGPLAVVNSGGTASVRNYQLSSTFEQFDFGVTVFMAGFLVDDLDFD